MFNNNSIIFKISIMRMERLELSQHKLLVSKTSASTISPHPLQQNKINLQIKFKDLFFNINTIDKTCLFASKHGFS